MNLPGLRVGFADGPAAVAALRQDGNSSLDAVEKARRGERWLLY